jgi:TolB protein
MRRHLFSIAAGARTCAAILVLAACTDSARVTAPDAVRSAPNAAASRQGPTSARILYARFATLETEPEIYTMDDDGTNVTRLTVNLASDVDPSWAPDGKRVVYASDQVERATFAIYVMNADGTANTRLSNPSPVQSDRDPRALGKRIVFARRDLAADAISLWVMNDDGSDLTPLTNGTFDFSPAPSPNGKFVAFVRGRNVHVLDVETGEIRNLTNMPEAVETTPAWSPTGKQIAFARSDPAADPASDIYVINTDGTGVARLTNTLGVYDSRPRWSPDGKRIAFTANDGGVHSIWVMAADGTALNNLSFTHTPYFAEHIGAWAR